MSYRPAVMMTSGWDARIKDAKAFVNADASGTMHSIVSHHVLVLFVASLLISGVFLQAASQ
jgi:hypothetical protein